MEKRDPISCKNARYLAVDIGASSGRHIVASLENGKLTMREVYRFRNGVTERNGRLYWDADRLFDEIVADLKLERIFTHTA